MNGGSASAISLTWPRPAVVQMRHERREKPRPAPPSGQLPSRRAHAATPRRRRPAARARRFPGDTRHRARAAGLRSGRRSRARRAPATAIRAGSTADARPSRRGAEHVRIEQPLRQPADGEDLIRAARGVNPARDVIDIDDVVQIPGLRVPESGDELRARVVAGLRQAGESSPATRSAFSHSAWTSTGLPMRGVTAQSPTRASIHVSCIPARRRRAGHLCPGECRSACRARSPRGWRGPRRAAGPDSPLDSVRLSRSAASNKPSYGDDEPERGVDGVELRRFAGVGEAIGQHAHRTRLGPFEQDAARLVDRPVARHSPRSAMKVSRPQSVNQG